MIDLIRLYSTLLFVCCFTIYIADLKPPEEGEDGDEPPKREDDAAAAAADGQDGLDSQWNKRMKERLEQMKSKKSRDMSITVSQKSGVNIGALASRQRRTSSSDSSSTVGQGRVREELEQQQGSIQFLTGDEDGTVEICVQSILASIKNPNRFTLKVTWAAADEEEEKRQKSKEGGGGLDSSAVLTNMGRLERDIQTLQNRVKACLNNADFNKEQEASFHQQSVSMNKAAFYWPMIHLVVILAAGFTQANHIVTYLRRHHIGV